MSFNIRDVVVSEEFHVDDFEKNLPKEKFRQSQPVAAITFRRMRSVFESINYAKNILQGMDSAFQVAAPIKVDLDLEVTDEQRGFKVDLKYHIIESPGPIIGFLGHYYDASSGYILFDVNKTDEYIPLFNLRDYLSFNLELPRELTLEELNLEIEKYKLGEIDVGDMFKNIMNLGLVRAADDSFTIDKFKEEEIDKKKREEEEKRRRGYTLEDEAVKMLFQNLIKVRVHMKEIGQGIKFLFGYSIEEKNVGTYSEVLKSVTNDNEDLKFFFTKAEAYHAYVDEFMSMKTRQGNSSRRQKNTFYLSSSPTMTDSDEEVGRELSSMMTRKTGVNLVVRPQTERNISKSQSITTNFIDLIEHTEGREEIDEMILEDNFEDLKGLMDRLDLEDVMKGARLSAVKRGLKLNPKTTRFTIEKAISPTMDIRKAWSPQNYNVRDLDVGDRDYFSVSTRHEAHEVISKFISRVVKRLESL